MADAKFPKGIYFKLPNEKAPSFVKGSISIKRVELIQWLESEPDEWVNLQMKVSREGRPYLEVDTWKPRSENVPDKPQPSQSTPEPDHLPF